jgi:DNA-binding transcriptional ArsR family regulator
MKVLSNPDRMLLLCELSEGERNVGELQEAVGIQQPTLSQQLAVLRDEDLVATRREGKNIYYSIASAQAIGGAARAARTVLRAAGQEKEEPQMTIDWSHFTPWSSLAGGLLLAWRRQCSSCSMAACWGSAASWAGCCSRARADAGWRLSFLGGLLAAPAAWSLFAATAAPRIAAGPALLVLAGLLVGWGTRYGSGCTSGHGVCGLSRLSPRSLAATLAFMATGFATVFVLRHLAA